MIIRPAHPSESARLAALAMASKASWGYSAEQVQAWRGELTPSEASIAAEPTCVAEGEGTIAGFYQLSMQGVAASLEHLWIAPAMMRKGLGTMLLRHAVQASAAAGVANLHIDADPHAEAFYLACGAVRTGVRPAPTAAAPGRFRPQLVMTATRVG